MRLTERKTVDGYMKDIQTMFRKGQVLKEIVESSVESSIVQAKQAQPAFVKAAVAYIHLAEKAAQSKYLPSQMGKVVDSSEKRKALAKAFTLDTTEKIKLFQPEWYIAAQELFMYHLIEAVFDASLILEQSAQRRFRETVEFYRSFVKVSEVEGWTFGYYKKSVLFIDNIRGKVFIASNRVVRDRIAKVGIKEIVREKECGKINYNLVLNDGFIFTLMSGQHLTNSMWTPCSSLKDKRKYYIQVVLNVSEDHLPAVQYSAHTILLLAQFGINTVKHMILKDSLFTCSHVDLTGNNALWNLHLLTRRDNKLRVVCKNEEILENVTSYDLFSFWRYVDDSYMMNRIDERTKMAYLETYWKPLLQNRSPEEVLAC